MICVKIKTIMKTFPEKKIEFIAKTITDLGKAVVVVGLASYFFEKFPFVWRIAISIFSVVLIFTGILMFPEKGEE